MTTATDKPVRKPPIYRPVVMPVKASWAANDCIWILTGRCPFCHQLHTHGGGGSKEPHLIIYGLRKPLCNSIDLARAGLKREHLQEYELVPWEVE